MMRDKKYVEHKQKGEISKLGARGQSGKAVQTALHVNPNLGGGGGGVILHTQTHTPPVGYPLITQKQ